jgi:two-component system phosphate regulon sensor histidine kinase PhoR
MAIEADRAAAPAGEVWNRLKRARFVIIAAGAVFGILVAIEAVAPLEALIGFAIIGLASLIGSPEDAERAGVPRGREGIGLLAIDRVIEAAIAGLPDPAIVLDQQGIVVAFNEHARSIARALAVGEPVSFALRIPDVLEAVRRTTSTRQGARVEFQVRVPDRWFEGFIEPVLLPGEPGRELVLVALHDLTPIRRVEEMRADFVANASHELRTPLASLAGFIETLQGSARDDAQARERFLHIMKAQAMRMARLIDDLLSLSRIELKAHLQPQTFADLVAIVRQVADGLQMLAHDRGVEIRIEMPPMPLAVRGDRDELIRVFENLIENALKYGATGKRVGFRRRGGSGDCGARFWTGHCPGTSATTDRAVLPRRCRGKPCTGRNRPRACTCEAYSQSSSRSAEHRQHARKGRYFHCQISPGRNRARYKSTSKITWIGCHGTVIKPS